MGRRQAVFERNLLEIKELQAACSAGDQRECWYLFNARKRLQQDLEYRASMPAGFFGIATWLLTIVAATFVAGDLSYSWWLEGFTVASIVFAGLAGWWLHRLLLTRLEGQYREYLTDSEKN